MVGIILIVIKVVAGVLENFFVVRVINFSSVLEELKKEGFWIYGIVVNEGELIYIVKFIGVVVLVVGSEVEGLSFLI